MVGLVEEVADAWFWNMRSYMRRVIGEAMLLQGRNRGLHEVNGRVAQ